MGTRRTTRTPPRVWESLDAAAKRLGRHAGHLRRVCPELERRKLARWVKGGGTKAHWQIRRDAELSALGAEAPAGRPQPIVLRVGDTSIRIDSTAAVTLTISPAAGGGGKRSQTPSEGHAIDIR